MGIVKVYGGPVKPPAVAKKKKVAEPEQIKNKGGRPRKIKDGPKKK